MTVTPTVVGQPSVMIFVAAEIWARVGRTVPAVSGTAMPLDARGAPSSVRPGRRRFNLSWLGLVPFLAFSTLFLIIPTSYLVIGSFKDNSGAFTLQNYADLTGELPLNAYLNSIEISVVTAVLGGIFGFLAGWGLEYWAAVIEYQIGRAHV